MKKLSLYSFVLLLFLLVSCSAPVSDKNNYYDEMIEGNNKRSTFLYILSSENEEERIKGLDYYLAFDFPPELTTTIFFPEDSVSSAITIYKAYRDSGDFDKARTIVSTYLIKQMSLKDVTTLVTNYPVDSDYLISLFSLWQPSLKDEDKDDYITLFLRFTELDKISEESAKTYIKLINNLESDSYFNSNNNIMSQIFKNKAKAYFRLGDLINAAIYEYQSIKASND